jgi:hypothetical protein
LGYTGKRTVVTLPEDYIHWLAPDYWNVRLNILDFRFGIQYGMLWRLLKRKKFCLHPLQLGNAAITG